MYAQGTHFPRPHVADQGFPVVEAKIWDLLPNYTIQMRNKVAPETIRPQDAVVGPVAGPKQNPASCGRYMNLQMVVHSSAFQHKYKLTFYLACKSEFHTKFSTLSTDHSGHHPPHHNVAWPTKSGLHHLMLFSRLTVSWHWAHDALYPREPAVSRK